MIIITTIFIMIALDDFDIHEIYVTAKFLRNKLAKANTRNELKYRISMTFN